MQDQGRRKYLGVFLLTLFLCVGCAKLKYLPQLLTLKDLADNQEQTEQYIQEQDNKYTQLSQIVQSNEIQQYSDEQEILKAFGQPILMKSVIKDDEELNLWLYRKQMEYWRGEKVHLYFDRSGSLMTWEWIPAKK